MTVSSSTPSVSTCTLPSSSFHAPRAAARTPSKSKSGISSSAFAHAFSGEMKLIPTRTYIPVSPVPPVFVFFLKPNKAPISERYPWYSCKPCGKLRMGELPRYVPYSSGSPRSNPTPRKSMQV